HPSSHRKSVRRGTQVVRERSANPLYVGSIPTRASNLFLQFPDSTELTCLPILRYVSASMGENWAKTGSGSDKNRTKFGHTRYRIWSARAITSSARAITSSANTGLKRRRRGKKERSTHSR